ncbi:MULTISPECIES: rhodanese-like domain-containing protein [Cetobacterium]|jgi:rhodanese-related sulfurtransferase|uniref:Rhodanese-like domain-containing protein n=1 Tax=Candidatus Cetobacterium colombiensis TaxID=3073100 RepID=A0ABU4WDB9_9FUSO|nr:rhodanese-like domain-containing protein [Candidatus Cetobacterium colombiensis]MDX8336385.1 rhodanese-like domain-containing protein [Candidatus Cetobacterium colombiensis]
MLEERYKTLTQTEVKEAMKNNDVVLLDVRTEDEYFDVSLKETINIPLNELEERAEELDKNKTYITFCRSGIRSKTAALILMEKGFGKVFNSQEGILTWK